MGVQKSPKGWPRASYYILLVRPHCPVPKTRIPVSPQVVPLQGGLLSAAPTDTKETEQPALKGRPVASLRRGTGVSRPARGRGATSTLTHTQARSNGLKLEQTPAHSTTVHTLTHSGRDWTTFRHTQLHSTTTRDDSRAQTAEQAVLLRARCLCPWPQKVRCEPGLPLPSASIWSGVSAGLSSPSVFHANLRRVR